MAKPIQIRVLGPTAIEDYHAHLLRLDRGSRFPAADDRAIDSHCLTLMAQRAILVGAYVDGVLRGGAGIVPDRTGRRAEAAITVEPAFADHGFERGLTDRIIAEGRRHNVAELRVLEQSETRSYRIPAAAAIPPEAMPLAANG